MSGELAELTTHIGKEIESWSRAMCAKFGLPDPESYPQDTVFQMEIRPMIKATPFIRLDVSYSTVEPEIRRVFKKTGLDFLGKRFIIWTNINEI